MENVEKIVVVTKKTALEELIERFNTRDQARFYIEHMGGSFDEYQSAHDRYYLAKSMLVESIPQSVRYQVIDRDFLPNFTFGDRDLVVTLGPDGLVVNTAKYLKQQNLLAFNPDAQRMDGVLIPFIVEQAKYAFRRALQGQGKLRKISMAKVSLNDGQTLYALNDFFIGQRTHVSARYRLKLGRKIEHQSSSGIIVSTGAGSSGWFRSLLTGAAGIIEAHLGDEAAAKARDTYQVDAESDTLHFCVREPFVSKVSKAELVFGKIPKNAKLEIVSEMPQNGIIFSDGIESDFIEFNSGSVALVSIAERKLNLLA